MRRRLVAAGVAALLAAGFAAGLGRPAGRVGARAAESITVSNTNASTVTTATVLDPDHRYRIEASGTVSDWCAAGATGCPSPPNVGVDALYCYVEWRCGSTPQLWRQLVVDGEGLDQFAGLAGKIPYSAAHTYSVTVTGKSGALTLGAADALSGSTSDNSGSFKVTITDEGPTSPTAGNLLIVGIGDSLASGEGNPDVPKQGRTPAKWQSHQCDRSGDSFDAQVVRRLEKNRGTKIDFVYLACSGASIPRGLLGPYAGINPGEPLPPQVAEARRRVGNRKPDAVLLSVGVNDLEFGAVVTFCAKAVGDCMNKTYRDNLTLRDWMARQVGLLPDRYAQLASALAPLAPPERIVVGLYPDLLRDDQGNLCGTRTILTLNEREVRWMHDSFYLPLNAAVRAAAKRYKWRLVEGQEGAFRRHGYCADNHWIVRYQESKDRQGNENGTLHPNLHGHSAIANLFYRRVSAVLK